MNGLIKRIASLSDVPRDDDSFQKWLRQDDALAFLRDNSTDDEIAVYVGTSRAFIHGILVPNDFLENPDIPDLLSWNGGPSSSWSVAVSGGRIWLDPPLQGVGSKTIAEGEQIVFARSFEGVPERRDYFEVAQPLTHTAGLHFMPERNAWCRLDRHGDMEDVIRVVAIPAPEGENWGGRVVLVRRKVLETYAALTKSSLVRVFDFSRFRPGSIPRWGSHAEVQRSDDGLHYQMGNIEGIASYTRGVQIIPFAVTQEELRSRFWEDVLPTEERYATFIAYDWKNQRIDEISCAPDHLANYFTKSDLPFEITPAFFRPEVLLKYKADRAKYTLRERSVSCRGAWHLKTFDINEAGQVHTYLVYLSQLPYEEQLHWKQYNEPPKGPISKRALATDINGDVYDEHNPLGSLKVKLSDWRERRVPWWTLRSDDLEDHANYPFAASADEWAGEILTLDQLVVEGFEEKWLRAKATELGRSPKAQWRSLKLIEECLIALGFEDDHARSIVSPLHDLHNLRSKTKGHASDETARSIRSSVLAEHRSFRNHFTDLATRCDEAIGTITDAFRIIETAKDAIDKRG